MKSKILLLVILGVIVACSVIYYRRPTNPVENLELDSIESIMIYCSDPGIQFEDEEKIKEIYNILDSMILRKKIDTNRDGSMRIEINLRTGEVIYYTLDASEFKSNNGVYQTDRNYYEIFMNLISALDVEK